ncbi:MAG: hypothetical protein MR224_05500 [Dorea sp.]|nr:hypothetical protein [Dorea sp.]
MIDNIYHICEIRDDAHGADEVNNFLKMGWVFISACQVGTPDGMDIVYVVGATKEVYESYIENSQKETNSEFSRLISQKHPSL